MRFIMMAAVLLFTVSAQAQTVFENVTVLTMQDDQVIENGRVITSGDRITAVGTNASLPMPDGATVIDGTGKFLMPGLAEMHGHLPYSNWSEEQTRDTLFLYLAGGVTTVRGMLGDRVQFKLRDAIHAGDMAGPMLYLAAPSMNGNTVTSPQKARELVRQYAAEGWDLLKIHPGIKMDSYLALADEAHKQNITFGGHVPEDVGLKTALDAGQVSLDHIDGYMALYRGGDAPLTDAQLSEAVALTLESGTWIVPTQLLFNLLRSGGDLQAMLARDENKYVPQSTVDGWASTVRRLNISANKQFEEKPRYPAESTC